MRKRLLKNRYLKKGLLFIGILITLTNCEKETIFINDSKPNLQNKSFLKDVKTSTNTFDFFIKQPKFFDAYSLIKTSYKKDYNVAEKSIMEQEYGFIIDSSKVKEVIYNDYTSYTMRVITKKEDNNTFTNFLLEIYNPNDIRAYLLTYSPTENWLNNYYNNTANNFEGEITYQKINYNPNIANRSALPCEDFIILYFVECSGITHTYPEEFDESKCFICGGTGGYSVSERVTACYFGGDGTDTTGSGDTGGTTSGSTSTGGSSTTPDGDDKPIGPITDLIAPDKIIIDPSFESSKAKCVYDLLIKQDGLKNVLSNLLPENSDYVLIFKTTKDLKNLKGDKVNGLTTGNYLTSSKEIIIEIDKDISETKSFPYIASILIHESIHAKLFEMVKSVGGINKLGEFANEETEFGKLWAYYDKYGFTHGWQHDFMYDNYLTEVANATENFHKTYYLSDYNNFHNYVKDISGYNKDTFYEDIAKYHLRGSSKFPNDQLSTINLMAESLRDVSTAKICKK